ncbi:MAG: DUF2520 domain-containing protein [Bacillota bacterium]|nr:DUF2520 domain-containing protein [Bacillota bacterium]
MRAGFIGAGKVGFSLGKYFMVNGIEVTGYYSRNENSAREASVFTKTKHFMKVEDLINESSIIFLTVPDDEIYNLWNHIKNLNIREKIICHTSGSLSSNIFSNHFQSDVYVYSIHPLFPISDKFESYKFLKNALFTIEGNDKYVKELTELFNNMGNKIIVMKNSDKTLYHLAAVTVSNLFCGLINRSVSYLMEYGFSENDAVEALYPLIAANINNIKENGIVNALTGPVERGDVNTLKKHLSVIPKDHESTYKDLSMELIKIAKIKNEHRDYKKCMEELK